MALEQARCRAPRAVVMVARDSEARQRVGVAQAEQRTCPLQFLLKAQGGCVAGEDDAVRRLTAQVVDQRREDALGVAEASSAAQPAQIEPRRQPLVEPVLGEPAERTRRDVDVADVNEADRLHALIGPFPFGFPGCLPPSPRWGGGEGWSLSPSLPTPLPSGERGERAGLTGA